MRVVFNAAKRSGGFPSFNDCLMNFMKNGILPVFIGFCNGLVAGMTDLRKFHNQVRVMPKEVPKEEKPLERFEDGRTISGETCELFDTVRENLFSFAKKKGFACQRTSRSCCCVNIGVESRYLTGKKIRQKVTKILASDYDFCRFLLLPTFLVHPV